MPVRDAQGRFVPALQPADALARDRDLLARVVWLLERLLWQSSGTVSPFAQYRQFLRQEEQRDA